jgi:hypothetical protein
MPNTDPPIDLDNTVPLSPREVDHIRRVLRDDDRMSWLGRKLRFLVLPIAVAVATGAWQLVEWVLRHVKVTP